jgi:hypothetical protein
LLAQEKKFVMHLLRENEILKQGVRIQNRRFEVINHILIKIIGYIHKAAAVQ